MLERIVSRIEEYQPRVLDLAFKDAAVLVPITRETEPNIILTRRSDQMKTHSGQVAFPGGMQEQGDQDLRMTALRETEEEIGLGAGDIEILGSLSQVVSRYKIRVTPYVGLVNPNADLIPCPRELDSVFKVPLHFFLDAPPARIDHLGFENHKLDVPCWFYEGYEIWGMSAVILVDFFKVVFERDLSV